MSFFEEQGLFVWSCDTCSHEAVFRADDFYSCVRELRDRGWQFMRDDEGGWSHSCGRCVYKRRQVPIMERTFKSVK
jgi:hypothetical protein